MVNEERMWESSEKKMREFERRKENRDSFTFKELQEPNFGKELKTLLHFIIRFPSDVVCECNS